MNLSPLYVASATETMGAPPAPPRDDEALIAYTSVR